MTSPAAPDLRFLIYSMNYSPELTGIGKYNGELAQWMAQSGNQVDVICAPPYYPEWQVHRGYSNRRYQRKKIDGVTVTRCPVYVPRHPNPLQRLLHLFSFAISSSISLFFKFLRKPDVVFVVQPTLFCVPLALLFCKLTGARSILHIQDFEVDAMFGLNMAKSSEQRRRARLATRIEKFFMSGFDVVSSISQSMLVKAQQKGVDPDKLVLFPNWSDTDFINPDVDGNQLREAWGIKENEKIILYAGNLGAKQGLELVIEAAELFKERLDIKFLIVGTGAQEERLRRLASEKSIPNLEFKPLIEWENVPAMLTIADVHLVIQRKGVADAVLPSKLTNILSAGGHAVVTAESGTELDRLALKHPGIYTVVKPESLEGLVTGINTELTRVSEGKINKIARRYAESNLNQREILKRFNSRLHAMIESPRPIEKVKLNS